MLSSVILSLAAMFISSPPPGGSLRQQIKKELAAVKGTFAVAFQDLQTGERILINAKQNFHAASTMKTPVMIEVYKQAAAGRFSLSDSIKVHQNFKSIADDSEYVLDQTSDSDQELYREMGRKVDIYNLLYRMIIQSSNLATNLIIELVGAEKVNQTMRSIGAKDIRVLRGVEDLKAYEKGLNNTTTAYDQLLIYTRLAQGKIADEAATKAMTAILLDQKFNEIIPAKLPMDVKVAHKTGSISGVQHDAGIVYLPDGRKYVLVLLSKGLEDEKAGIAALARVSETFYNAVSGNLPMR